VAGVACFAGQVFVCRFRGGDWRGCAQWRERLWLRVQGHALAQCQATHRQLTLQAQVYQQPQPEEMAKMLALSSRFGVMTRVTELESMAASVKDGIPQMISIKAVDPKLFPFYGDLKMSPASRWRHY
jgi:predicted lysophospholipase L1 biosynthesis ABC-type transport system permease subunit